MERDKFVVGEVYRFRPPLKPSLGYEENGFLWIYVGVQDFDGGKRPTFKSIATGEVDWWPSDWMEGLD
jgi:hypothetical protein